MLRRLLQLPSTRHARWLVLWCLLLALPVQGLSGVLLQWLGAQHRHQAEVADAGALTTGWELRFRSAMAGYASPALAFRPAQQPADHGHGVFERHHHAADDASVLALGPTEPNSDLASDAAQGAAVQPLAVHGLLAWHLPATGRSPWALAPSAGWQSQPVSRLERPPRG